VGKLVTGTNNEVFKCVVGIQVGIEKSTMLGAAVMRGTPYELIRRIFKDIFYFERLSKKIDRTFIYQA